MQPYQDFKLYVTSATRTLLLMSHAQHFILFRIHMRNIALAVGQYRSGIVLRYRPRSLPLDDLFEPGRPLHSSRHWFAGSLIWSSQSS